MNDTAKTTETENLGQLEFGLAPARPRGNGRRPCGSPRAGWWFERMRQLVDRACDWEPAPPARPEQIAMSGMYRQPSVLTGEQPFSAPAQSEQQQITE